MLEQLARSLAQIRDDPRARAVVLIGAGERAFSAGADIRYLHDAAPLAVRAYARLAVAVTQQIEALGKPTVAALNGLALGGGLELAEACMLRVAARGVALGHPEVRIGAVAGFGGMARLPRLIGRGRAADLLLTGRTIDAAEGERLGLISRVVEPAALRDEALALAQEILAQAPLAVALTWEGLHRGADLPLDEAARLAADQFGLVAASEDFRIGTQAFLSRTPATFVGR
jgi:enoyl-CoA hydratase